MYVTPKPLETKETNTLRSNTPRATRPTSERKHESHVLHVRTRREQFKVVCSESVVGPLGIPRHTER